MFAKFDQFFSGFFQNAAFFESSKGSEPPRASPKFPRSFPDVLQFGGQPTPPIIRPFLASSSARPSWPAALRDVVPRVEQEEEDHGTTSKHSQPRDGWLSDAYATNLSPPPRSQSKMSEGKRRKHGRRQSAKKLATEPRKAAPYNCKPPHVLLGSLGSPKSVHPCVLHDILHNFDIT